MDRATAEPRVDAMPGDRAAEWAARHRSTAATTTYVYDFVWDHTAPAAGPFCTDVDGNVLLDFTSHVGAAPLGYDNPKIVEPMAAFDLVDPIKIAGQDFYARAGTDDEPAVPGPTELMERLTEATSHYGMDTVFLSNSGAEAVENGLKIAYDHTGADHGLTFQGAFHGRTLGALSLNRSKGVYRRDFPEIAGVHDVPFCADRGCTPERCGCGFFRDDPDVGSALRRALDPKRGYLDPDDVAYLILEPIQGEGGYNFPSEAFAAEVAAVADEFDLVVIADEIQSGVGRTGEMWGVDHYPIEPDVITCAKALRVGATVGREAVFPDERSRISSTWGAGDLLSSLQGALTLDAIREHDLLANAVERGRSIRERLADADLDGVSDVRGKGLMIALDLPSPERRDDVVAAALEHGLLTLACGHRTVRLLPPLDLTEREAGLGVDLLAEAVEATG